MTSSKFYYRVSVYFSVSLQMRYEHKIQIGNSNQQADANPQIPGTDFSTQENKILWCGNSGKKKRKKEIPRSFSLSCFYWINRWNAQNLYIYTHVCSHSETKAGAETQMHPLKHILLFLIAGGFKITQIGVPEATVSRSLSIIHPFIHSKAQQFRQPQTAVPHLSRSSAYPSLCSTF